MALSIAKAGMWLSATGAIEEWDKTSEAEEFEMRSAR